MDELSKGAGPGIMLPLLRYVGFKGLTLWRNHLENLKALFSSIVQEHKETYTEGSPRWVDRYVSLRLNKDVTIGGIHYEFAWSKNQIS